MLGVRYLDKKKERRFSREGHVRERGSENGEKREEKEREKTTSCTEYCTVNRLPAADRSLGPCICLH